MKPEKPKIYDRLSNDLPINADVAISIVDDPLEQGAKLKVLRNVRSDPLANMFLRGHIDEAQFNAGRDWQGHYEAAEVGGASAIDYEKTKVDGGRIPEPITDRKIKALRELNRARHDLGEYGQSLVFDILGRHMTFEAIATARMFTERQQRGLLPRFRECLETLAKLWGRA